jgi:succinate dehydrogenase / fumarate reductase iron-sulfur subunit
VTCDFDIMRFDPEAGTPPRLQRFRVEADPTDRVIDVLLRIRTDQDPTLGLRCSCVHGVCGSDAMRINGKERLACKTLLRDALPADGERVVRVEPLRHFPVKKDLVVDQAEFFRRIRSLSPFLLPGSDGPPSDGKEVLQSAAQHAPFEDATKCISCGACFSACPVLEANPRFVGPAAIVQAARFVEDSRDRGLAPRLDALDTPDGVWACESHFECTRVCPREIKVTKLINIMKRRVTKDRESRGEPVHDGKAAGA